MFKNVSEWQVKNIVRMDAQVPANKALQLMALLSDAALRKDSWKRLPGSPCRTSA